MYQLWFCEHCLESMPKSWEQIRLYNKYLDQLFDKCYRLWEDDVL